MFHHMFREFIDDLECQINSSGEYAVEFATDGVFLLSFIRFCHGDQLCRVFLKRTGRVQGQTQAGVCLIWYIIGAISTKPRLVKCTGSSARTVQLVDQSPYSPCGVQSTPRFEELTLSTLMHKKSQSVFGRKDFFSVLRYLVISLRGSSELDWVLLSPELTKVNNSTSSSSDSSFPGVWAYLSMWGFVLLSLV